MKKLIKKLIDYLKLKKVFIKCKKDIKRHEYMFKGIKLTKSQIGEVYKVWEPYVGKNVDLRWHKMYMSYEGIFDKYYIPELYFQTIIIPVLNPNKISKHFSNKILINNLFKDLSNDQIVLPRIIVANCNKFFYMKDKIVSEEKVLNEIYNAGEVVIKPITDTNSGKGVKLLDIKNGIDLLSGEKIEKILNNYQYNYMIQSKIHQHKSLAKLNSSSVNTIRINTFICNGKVYATPMALRIGRNGKFVDNAHAGGLQVGIDDNGFLRKYAFNEYGEKYDYHPDSQTKFEGYTIPKIKEIRDFAINNHFRIPHIGFIGWDFTVDINENIVLVEANIICPGIRFPQYCNGESLFGEQTIDLLKMVKKG